MVGLTRRRRLRCFYCNTQCRADQAGIPTTWACPHCDATNYLDERGEITDPPEQVVTAAPRVHYAREPSAALNLVPAAPPFCDVCLQNQAIVERIMAEYLPDEDDPLYNQQVASLDRYRAQVEDIYPPVCDNCINRVRDQVRASGYTAKADHLRRILQSSKANQEKQQARARKLYWLHLLLVLTKYIYIINLITAVLWHTAGSVVGPGDAESFSWQRCGREALIVTTEWPLSLDPGCFRSKSVLSWVKWGLVLDLLTLWWNPRIGDMIYRPFGRMQGLGQLWLARILVFGLRLMSLHCMTDIPEDRTNFQRKHIVILVLISISALITWTRIRISSASRVTAFSKPEESYLPTAPSISGTNFRDGNRPVSSGASAFDSMAQAFTTSFNAPGSSQDLDLPPTPSSTTSSGSLSEIETPYKRTTIAHNSGDDSMDWTPTQQDRFGLGRVEVQPPLFSQPSSQSTPQPQPQPRSILSANKPRDPNPFHQKIPAVPKGPRAQKQDPWNQSIWNPALQDNKNRFLDDIMKQGQSKESRQEIENGVPKKVRRDAELFQEPKLRYDYSGLVNQKTTGLEDVFNKMFQP